LADNNFQPIGDPERGYVLNFAPNPAQAQHAFCGEHSIAGAWCPHCDKPLLRVLSLDARDPALNLDAEQMPFVHLLYCWTCSIPYGEFSYRCRPDGSVELLKVPLRMPDVELGPDVYEGYTGRFPLSHVSLEPLEQSLHDALAKHWASTEAVDSVEEGFEPIHQVGGYPFLYNPFALRCPVCLEWMAMLASFCDDATGNKTYQPDRMSSFVDNCGVQMFFQCCRKCATVSAAHSCD